MKRAIEDSFPIVEINRLAVPERNSFKPIYQIHKWFARRASCVFRAILLGALKPLPLDEKGNPTKTGAELIMDEFYKDHTNDPDTDGKLILDPFMGGGTTVVEALRLGCNVIGIDLNPVAWFIVNAEVELVEIEALEAAFERLASRPVDWSGKSVRATLLDQYKTQCPCCRTRDAEIIHTFWVKSAICHNQLCPARSGDRGSEVRLFSNYIIAQKKPSIRYWPNVRCPECAKTFDWETEPAAIVGDPKLTINDTRTSGGEGRGHVRWTFSAGKTVCCPWCEHEVKPLPSSPPAKKGPSRERKKVPLTVLLCPHCESIWQWRGELSDQVSCPACRKDYAANTGNVPEKGKFVCPSCGAKQAIIESVRQLPKDQLLPTKPYAIEGHCICCTGEDDEKHDEPILFGRPFSRGSVQVASAVSHSCSLSKNKGKFFKTLDPADIARYQTACQTWEREKRRLPYPKQEIPWGEKTKTHLIGHHFRYWHQLFNPRQLLCLSTILQSIQQHEESVERNMLLSNFQMLIERNNLFCRYYNDRDIVRGMFARHDFHPLNCPAETNVFGSPDWGGTWNNLKDRLIEGKRFNLEPFDWLRISGSPRIAPSREKIDGRNSKLSCGDSRNVSDIVMEPISALITDPPYADNVNYSELADVFYVWLRLALSRAFPCFAPEHSPKSNEIIENRTRSLTRADYRAGLTQVFQRSASLVDSDGVIAFTFHHREGTAWEALLEALMEAGLSLLAVYPIHGESESSLHLRDKEAAVSYDLIHVCKRCAASTSAGQRSWAGLRLEIRQRAREEIRAIEAGRYGNEPLSPTDVNIVLIGKCLEQYSRYYSKIVDHEGNPVPLHDALEEIKVLVDQLTNQDQELPTVLEAVDPLSYVYLTCLSSRREIKSDEVHKATRGILEPEELVKAGLMTKGRTKGGRTYEIKSPIERLTVLKAKFGSERTTPQIELFDDELAHQASSLSTTCICYSR
jgi:hypothetical protein